MEIILPYPGPIVQLHPTWRIPSGSRTLSIVGSLQCGVVVIEVVVCVGIGGDCHPLHVPNVRSLREGERAHGGQGGPDRTLNEAGKIPHAIPFPGSGPDTGKVSV